MCEQEVVCDSVQYGEDGRVVCVHGERVCERGQE